MVLFVLYSFLFFLQSHNTAVQVQIDSYFSDVVFWVLPTVDFFCKVGSCFSLSLYGLCLGHTKDISVFQFLISMLVLSVDDRSHALYCPVRFNESLSAPFFSLL